MHFWITKVPCVLVMKLRAKAVIINILTHIGNCKKIIYRLNQVAFGCIQTLLIENCFLWKHKNSKQLNHVIVSTLSDLRKANMTPNIIHFMFLK